MYDIRMPNKEINLLVANGNYGIVVLRKKEYNLGYYWLNSETQVDTYPIPKMNNLLD